MFTLEHEGISEGAAQLGRRARSTVGKRPKPNWDMHMRKSSSPDSSHANARRLRETLQKNENDFVSYLVQRRREERHEAPVRGQEDDSALVNYVQDSSISEPHPEDTFSAAKDLYNALDIVVPPLSMHEM